MTNENPIVNMSPFTKLFEKGRRHRGPWKDPEKLFRKIFVKIMLN